MPGPAPSHGLKTGEWWLAPDASPASGPAGRVRAPSRVLLEAYTVPSRRARLLAALVRAIDWFIPDRTGSLFDRVDARRSARMLVGVCLVAAVATLPLAVLRLDRPVSAYDLTVFLPQATLLLCPLLLKWTRWPALPALVVPSLGSVLLALSCLGPEGLRSAEVVLAPIVPIVAVLLLGVRAGVAFGLVTTTIVLAVPLGRALGVLDPSGAVVYATVATVSVGWAALALMLGHEHQRAALQSRLAKALKDLSESAVIDPLTRVHNRRFFSNRLSAEYSHARRHDDDFGVIVFDLDYFKKINDTYGHDAGDAVLVETAERVRNALRQEDILARYGGEEFVVLSRGQSTGLRRLAERLRLVIACEPMTTPSGAIAVSASFGCATLRGSASDSADALVRLADQCLYAAKKRGRNRVVAADDPTESSEIEEKSTRRAPGVALLASLPPAADRTTKIWFTGAG